MDSLGGHLLIAAPTLQDPNFACTVVLIVRHDADGALGLILNRPSEMTVEMAWEQVSELPCGVEQPLFVGGPCDGPLMAVHQQPPLGDQQVSDGVWFSAEREQLETLITHAPDAARYFVGYAGWDATQLEAEIDQGAWLSVPAVEVEFLGDSQTLWPRLIRMTTGITNLRPGIIPPDPDVN